MGVKGYDSVEAGSILYFSLVEGYMLVVLPVCQMHITVHFGFDCGAVVSL